MSEVSAEKIDRRRNGDPAAAARRRKMTIKLKHARQSLTSNSVDFSGQYASLARLFAHSAMSATPAMALVVIAVGATAGLWVPFPKVMTWGALLAAALAVRYGLGVAFLDSPDAEKTSNAWRRKFIAAETFAGASWALIVVLLLQSPDPNARTFVLVVLLLISGMTAMVASAIPFAVAGGLAPMAIAIVYVLGPGDARAGVDDVGAVRRHPRLFRHPRQSPAPHLARRSVVSGGKGRADRRTRTGQAQFRRGAPARGRAPISPSRASWRR